MTMEIIAATQPKKKFMDRTGAQDMEDIISYCARVSNPTNQMNFQTAAKLLKFCMRKKHWSIFTMGHIIMEVHTTRDIGRQMLRHWGFDFQEFSQRYSEVDTDNFVIREARLQDATNRQSSIELPEGHHLHEEWKLWQLHAADAASEAYEWAIANNIAKEQARAVLPEGMTPSVMYMGGTVREWYHYCTVRMWEDTQKEHRVLAQQAWENLKEELPFLKEVMFEKVTDL